MKNRFGATAALAAMLMSGSALADNYEYTYQPNLAQIHVTPTLHDTAKAYIAYPATKTKVIVAVLDGKADITQVDLAGKETTILVYNGNFNSFDSHATHVSGIIGAAANGTGVVGVDPFATILNIPVFDANGWVATDIARAALNAAKSNGARVVNMSYGPTSAGDLLLSGEASLFATYNSTLAGQGMLIVRAAGNAGINLKNVAYSGNAVTALNNLLVVGAVDGNNVIASFSNRPGNACFGGTKTSCTASDANALMNFFIVAPGVSILSDLPNNSLGYMSGTSMATPTVAGAAALVYQYALAGNTQLTPGDLASILKRSADDLGATGVDSVYGWGLLDVAKALQPVGTITVPTSKNVKHGKVGLTRSGMQSSSVVSASAFGEAISGIMVLDDYKRPFIIDAPTYERGSVRPAENPVENLMGQLSFSTPYTVTNADHSASLVQSGDAHHGGFTRASFEDTATHIDVGLGASAAYLNSADMPKGVETHYSRTMAETFFSGSGDAVANSKAGVFFGLDQKLSNDTTLSTLYIQSMPENFAAMPDRIAVSVMKNEPVSSLMKTGVSQAVTKNVTLGVSYGLLTEQGSMLGNQTEGAFSLDSTNFTHIASVNADAYLGKGLTLSAYAERSLTQASNAGNSLFSTNDWTSGKYGATLTQSGIFNSNDALKFSVLRPWRVDLGALNVRLPVGRELDGTVDYQNRSVDLSADRIPVQLGLGYMVGSDTLRYGAQFKWSNEQSATQIVPAVSFATGVDWSF